MGFFSHVHRLLCHHCRHTKPMQCPLKGKKYCRKAEDVNTQQSQFRLFPRQKRRRGRASRRILLRAKAMVERQLAKYSDSDLESLVEHNGTNEQAWDLMEHIREDEQLMPFDLLTELSCESQRPIVEPDFDIELDELNTDVPSELPTNIHWTETDQLELDPSNSIGIALTTRGRVRTPPHAWPSSMPANYTSCDSYASVSTYTSYTSSSPQGSGIAHAKTTQTQRRVRRKSIGSPVIIQDSQDESDSDGEVTNTSQAKPFYNLNAVTASDISITSIISMGTATVEHMTPSVPTMVTIKPVRRRPVPAPVKPEKSSSVPECLETARPSYRSSASRKHSVRTRRSIPPQLPRSLILPTIVQSPPESRTPSPPSSPTEEEPNPYKGNWKTYSDLGGYPTLRGNSYPKRYSANPSRYEHLARYKKPLPLLPTTTPTRAAPIVPYQPMPREMRLFLGLEPETTEATEEAKKAEQQARCEKRQIRTTEVRALIEARSREAAAAAAVANLPQRRPAPTTFDEIMARPQLPRIRRQSTAVAFAQSAGAAGQLLLTSAASLSGRGPASTSYNSIEGRRLLHSLRLFMDIPETYSAVQTLLFLLNHKRTRSLRTGSDLIAHVNTLSWRGILAYISDPVNFERAGRLIYCGEPLFSNKTCVHSFLIQKKNKKRPLDKTMKQKGTAYIRTQWTQWNLEFNPRRRYHQCWTGAGPSCLSGFTLAE